MQPTRITSASQKQTLRRKLKLFSFSLVFACCVSGQILSQSLVNVYILLLVVNIFLRGYLFSCKFTHHAIFSNHAIFTLYHAKQLTYMFIIPLVFETAYSSIAIPDTSDQYERNDFSNSTVTIYTHLSRQQFRVMC